MAQVAPKSDDSNLYFFQLCDREATLSQKRGLILEMAIWIPFIQKHSDNAQFGFIFRCGCMDFPIQMGRALMNMAYMANIQQIFGKYSLAHIFGFFTNFDAFGCIHMRMQPNPKCAVAQKSNDQLQFILYTRQSELELHLTYPFNFCN